MLWILIMHSVLHCSWYIKDAQYMVTVISNIIINTSILLVKVVKKVRSW